MTRVHWVDGTSPGRLAIASRPRGDDWLRSELSSWRGQGIDTIVSLLTPVEQKDLHLAEEEDLSSAEGLGFISFPIDDRSVPPSKEQLSSLVDNLEKQLSEGKNVLVHCRQGIGRSGLVAACVLVSKGWSVDFALQQLSASRGFSVPETVEQQDWIHRFAQSLAHSKS